MKKPFTLGKSALFLACGAVFHLSAQAQTADTATVDITGQISATTCNLSIADATGTSDTGTKTLDLGTVTTAGTFSKAGTLFGSSKAVTFTLKNTTNTGPCTAPSTTAKWNVILGFEPGSVATLADNTTYVKNQDKSGSGTNALMRLTQGNTGTGTALVLKETMGYTGTTIGTDAAFTSSISMSAQLASAGAEAPSSGAYTATIPLLVLYK